MFTKTHCQLRWKGVGSEVQPRPGSGAEPELVKICVKCKQADAASWAAGVCVVVRGCVCCGINPFTGVWPESTGVNAAAGAASRKTFVTFALRAAPSGNAPAARYAGGLLCVLPCSPSLRPPGLCNLFAHCTCQLILISAPMRVSCSATA